MIKLKIKKFFIFFSIFILIFTIFSWDFWALNFKIFFDFSKNNPIYSYNKSLFLAKKGSFSESLDNLPESLPRFENYFLELEGDIFYKLNYSTGQILQKYKNAQDIQFNSRLEEKINFLENNVNSEKNENNSSNFNEDDSQKLQNMENEISSILEDQKNRKEFLNPYRLKELEYSSEVKRLKNLINENSNYEQKDW